MKAAPVTPEERDTLRLLGLVWRSRVVFATACTVVGGSIAALLMRVLLVTRLNAQDVHLVQLDHALTAEVQARNTATERMERAMHSVQMSACLDRTPAEQTLAGLECPPELFKGALRGRP